MKWPHFSVETLARRLRMTQSDLRQQHGIGWGHEISYWAADRIAVSHGLLPYDIWPEWDDLTGIQRRCAECVETFIPSDPNEIYCSHACRLASKRRRDRSFTRKRRET